MVKSHLSCNCITVRLNNYVSLNVEFPFIDGFSDWVVVDDDSDLSCWHRLLGDQTRGGHSPTDVLGGDLDSESPAPPASQHNMAAETGQRHTQTTPADGSMEPKPRKHRWGSFLTTIERGFALNGYRRVRGDGEKNVPYVGEFLTKNRQMGLQVFK